jgi:ADP-ribose pyrophosphatase YjhB (NUDIX family)
LVYAQSFHSEDQSPKLFCRQSLKLCTACSPLGEATHQANFVLWQIRGKYPRDSPERIAAIEQQFRELSGQITTAGLAFPTGDSPSGPSVVACALVGVGGKVLILRAPDGDHWKFPVVRVEHGQPIEQSVTDMMRERFDARVGWIEFATAVEYVEWHPKTNTHEHTIMFAFDVDTDRSPDEIMTALAAAETAARWVPPSFLPPAMQPRRLRDHLVGGVVPARSWRGWPPHRPG